MGKLDELSAAIGGLKATTELQGATLTEIKDELKEIRHTLSINTESLKEHMMQTHLIKERNEILRSEHESYRSLVDSHLRQMEMKENDLSARMKPIEEHVQSIRGLARLGKIALPMLGIPAAIYYMLQIAKFLGIIH